MVVLYQYKCNTCNKIVSKFHSMKSDPIYKCSICKKKMEKMITSSSVIFKGDGFYSTSNKGSDNSESKNETTKSNSK